MRLGKARPYSSVWVSSVITLYERKLEKETTTTTAVATAAAAAATAVAAAAEQLQRETNKNAHSFRRKKIYRFVGTQSRTSEQIKDIRKKHIRSKIIVMYITFKKVKD